MLKNVIFHRLRGFDHFEMHDLGRVNLIVGTNNCGKTTVLEGIQTLTAIGDATTIWSILTRRGEDSWEQREQGGYTRHGEVRHLFHGHGIEIGNQFTVSGGTDSGEISLSAKIVESPEHTIEQQPRLFEEEVGIGNGEEILNPRTFIMSWRGPHPADEVEIGLVMNRRGGSSFDYVRRGFASPPDYSRRNRFITAAALSPDAIIELFESIVLTPEEESVIEALRVIEPSIERIATSGTERRGSSTRQATRGGMLVRCKGVKDRIPIGSMGDGIWRMLGLALALVESEGGILLVDEIDTGLHFTVMADMWRLVYATAKRLNVQVFASTHSRDCYESLAVICRENVSEGSDITIQRIERGKSASVAYTEQEIIAAAKRGMEVR